MSRRCMLAVVALLLVPSSAHSAQGFSANLSGAAEVPNTVSPGSGTAVFVLNDTQTELTYAATYSGLLGGVLEAHLHKGTAGVNGGVIFPLAPPFGALDETFGGTLSISPAQVADLLSGLYYVNIHTDRFPGGEIRGQLAGDVTPAQRGTWGRIKALYH